MCLFVSVSVRLAGHGHHHAEQAQLSAQAQHILHPSKEQPRDPVWHSALCWSGLLRNERSVTHTHPEVIMTVGTSKMFNAFPSVLALSYAIIMY